MAASLAGKLSGFLKNPTVKAVGVNTSWLMVDKLARMGVSLLMSVLIARHLGPKGFGQLSLATSFVGFFIPIASFGLDRILVRDFVKGTPEPGTILGTAMTWRVVGGLLIMLLATLISSFIYRGSNNMILLVAILGIAPVVQAGDVIDFLFQSRLESKYVAISKLSSLFLSTGIRIALLHFSASAMGFAIASLLESLLLTLFLIFSLYRRKVVKDAIRVSKTYVKRLIVEGWPLALNLAFHVVYLRVSVMCLGQMKGDAAVGQFAAATRIYDGIVPIFSLLCTSLFPTLVRAYEQDQKIFLDKFVKASKVLAAIGWCAAIGAGVGSIWVLPVLFGPKYQESGKVLAILAPGLLFQISSLARAAYLTIVSSQRTILLLSVSSAVVVTILNLLLVPKFGVEGAAISTTLAILFNCVIANWIFPATRLVANIQLKALFGR